ncbi:hypothetical protein B7463_g1019, partial [Scytalidium lignicola]
MHWFGNFWEGMQIDFPERDGKPATTWKLGAKLADEGYNQWPITVGPTYPAGAWVPFSCMEVGGSGTEHVIKIHMQIPHGGTESDRLRSRALQASDNLPEYAKDELEGLKTLTTHGCRSTPALINFMQCKQEEDMWVPGGYLLYLLMTKCPGKPIEHFRQQPYSKREEIRQALEVAHKESWRCGVVNDDYSSDNLLWDDVNKKCYFVDFKSWSQASSLNEWNERSLKGWFLQELEEVPGGGGWLLKFGDFASCNHQGVVRTPDIACLADDGGIRVVGEVKTPWCHDLTGAMQDPAKRQKWLGQIAEYMWSTRCKYGFMSTYEETVFIMQDVDFNDATRYALYSSNIIRHNTKSQKVRGPIAAVYENKVSLRECFLFLSLEIGAGSWQSANPMPANQWYLRR